MKTLIFQVWAGEMRPGTRAGLTAMRAYAKRIGAEHRLFTRVDASGCESRKHGAPVSTAAFWERLLPLWDDSFLDFERVLYADLDIFPVDGLTDSIFDVPCEGFGLCEEPQQPAIRQDATGRINGFNDRVWAARVRDVWGANVPVDHLNRVRVFNGGLVLWTRLGILCANAHFVKIRDYIRQTSSIGEFYTRDQNYLHAMAFTGKVPFTILPQRWNVQIHGLTTGGIYDGRQSCPDAAMVHVQLGGADHHDAEWHHRRANLPQSQW